jgi:predicted DNA-binding protein (MmcQ/YjbR family)
MPNPLVEDRRLGRLTEICLALPEATRERSGSHATFRMRGKTFAYFLHDHHGDGIVAVACRTARGENVDWVRLDPVRFYLPAYIGARGWVALRLDAGSVDWREVADLVVDSYRLGAPKRLAALLPHANRPPGIRRPRNPRAR